jgi:hypothetical protein
MQRPPKSQHKQSELNSLPLGMLVDLVLAMPLVALVSVLRRLLSEHLLLLSEQLSEQRLVEAPRLRLVGEMVSEVLLP